MTTRYETIRVERRGATAILWMDRPEKKNAMTPQFFRELPLLLAELDADDAVRTLVLTGVGDAFSAGADLATLDQLTDLPAYRRQLQLVENAFHALERAAKPVIAAVNGVAYAGGMEIVLYCDFVIAAQRARFALREVRIGLQPGYALVRAPEVIGRQWTKRLAMTGEAIAARQAQELGLVQEVVADDEVVPAAVALAERIAANPPIAVQVGKRFVNRTTEGGGLRETMEATTVLFTTDDFREGVRAFLEKREPKFTGR